MKLIDMTGWVMKEHGVPDSRITVIKRDIENKSKITKWICKCECGNIFSADGTKLRSGWTKSCGCLQKEITSTRTRADLTDKQFGYLTAIRPLGKYGHSVLWECRCKCGNIKQATSNNLLSGETLSCGCLKSYGESLVNKILQEYKINFIPEYNLGNLKNLSKSSTRLDFGIINKNNQLIGAIEVNGEQHYDINNPWYNQGVEDNLKLKEEYCSKHNIPILIINYINKNLNKQKIIDFIQQFKEE